MSENPTQSVPATEVAGKTLVEEFMVMSYEFRRNKEMNVKYQHVNDLITTFLIQLATCHSTSLILLELKVVSAWQVVATCH